MFRSDNPVYRPNRLSAAWLLVTLLTSVCALLILVTGCFSIHRPAVERPSTDILNDITAVTLKSGTVVQFMTPGAHFEPGRRLVVGMTTSGQNVSISTDSVSTLHLQKVNVPLTVIAEVSLWGAFFTLLFTVMHPKVL